MIINKSILHIFDFISGVSVFSQKELDSADSTITTYIEKHIKRINLDPNKKKGVFNQESIMHDTIRKYISKKISFIDLSIHIADILYKQIESSDKLDSSDLLITEFTENEITYIAILLLSTKEAYTHHVTKQGDIIFNNFIKHKAILPTTTQKIDSFAVICCKDFSIQFNDQRRFINGEDCFIFPDILLQCSSEMSNKEVITIVNSTTKKVAEKYGVNPTTALARAKTYLVENAETSESFSAESIGKEIFIESEEMQFDFQREVAERNLPKEINIERSLAVRTGKKHKIKTDTGIEITVPSEYFENHEYIEITNNTDGTLSIKLKNIGKIIDK